MRDFHVYTFIGGVMYGAGTYDFLANDGPAGVIVCCLGLAIICGGRWLARRGAARPKEEERG